MAAGNLREKIDDTDNQCGQSPVRIIENNRDPREQRSSQQREERNSEYEECDRNNYKICDQRNWRNQVKVPKDERQRTNPRCQRYRYSTRNPFITGVHPTTRAAHQRLWQERVRSAATLENPEEWIAEQHNCANHCEGKLEPGGKQFVRVPAENEKRRGGQAVCKEHLSLEKQAAD